MNNEKKVNCETNEQEQIAQIRDNISRMLKPNKDNIGFEWETERSANISLYYKGRTFDLIHLTFDSNLRVNLDEVLGGIIITRSSALYELTRQKPCRR